MRAFFNKIYNAFIGLMCFLMMTAVVLMGTLPSNDGTSLFSGFLAFALWIIFLFVLIKGHPVLSAVLSVVIIIGLKVYKSGFDSVFTEDIKQGVAWILVLGFFYLLIKGTHASDVAYSEKLKSGVCPRCGGKLVFVPESHIVTGYDTVDKGGHWEYDYSDSQTKSYWVKDIAQVPEYETIRAHYECPNCRFKS